MGQSETLGRIRGLVRSTFDSGHAGLAAAGPFRANKGLMHRSNKQMFRSVEII
jgi:hypothetical protein